jgi:hypothetical protein
MPIRSRLKRPAHRTFHPGAIVIADRGTTPGKQKKPGPMKVRAFLLIK